MNFTNITIALSEEALSYGNPYIQIHTSQLKDDDKFKRYMPDYDVDELPERQFFFGVRINDVRFFLDSWDTLWQLAQEDY